MSPKIIIDQIKNQIGGKHILFDTNIISKSSDNADSFADFITEIKAYSTIIYNSLIEFEFLRGAHQLEHKNKRREYLEYLGQRIPFQEKGLLGDAIKIANVYTKYGIAPSLVDCCLAAILKQFGKRIFLATLNHKDFPMILFDRLEIIPIGTDREIFPIALYQYNNEKAKKLGII